MRGAKRLHFVQLSGWRTPRGWLPFLFSGTFLKVYYDGNSYVATENANPYKNQSVIITLLDEQKEGRRPVTLEELDSFAIHYGNSDNAQDYINKMRTDRAF